MGGNRSAKSGWLGRAVVGICSHTYPVRGMYPDEPVHWRHVSEAGLLRDMMQPLMESMMPAGFIKRRQRYPGGGFDEMWWLRDGGFLSFVTHHQDPADMAGGELHGFSFDEPITQQLWSENWRRLSAKWRKVMGAMTPLGAGSWFVDEFVTHRRENACIVEMPIWANCECLGGIEPSKLRRIGKPVGLAKEKHPKGCKCNHGFLSQEVIRTYLAGVSSWELEAAEWGTPLFLQRRIYPEYAADEYNTFDPAKMSGWLGEGRNRVPREGTLWVALDPADARPDAALFTVVTQDERRWTLRELPDYRAGRFRGHFLDQLKTGRAPVAVSVQEIAQVVTELGMRGRMGTFMGFDPHYTHNTFDQTDLPEDIVKQYNDAIEKHASWLPRFRRVDPHRDGQQELKPGHKAVAEWFVCDKSRPLDFRNSPRWRDSIFCDNLLRSTINYRRKEDPKNAEMGLSDQPSKEFKDMNDVRRYKDAMKPYFIPAYEFRPQIETSYSSAAA